MSITSDVKAEKLVEGMTAPLPHHPHDSSGFFQTEVVVVQSLRHV